MKVKALPIAFGLALAGPANAGTLNVDFEEEGFGTTMSEPGILGQGNSWNTAYDRGLINPVHDNGNQFTNPVLVVVAPGGSIDSDGSLPASTTNNVHRDGIYNSTGSLQVFITNLRPGVPLKLIIYLASGDPPYRLRATVAETGESKTAGNATRPDKIEDAVEGADYLIFEGSLTNASGVLEFTISNPTHPDGYTRISGLQIQGWLPGEEFPSKTDLHLSKKKNSGYVGDDVYGGRQLQKITGKRRGRFYYEFQNDADVWATYGLRGKGNDGDAIRKWFDLLDGRKNITAKVATGSYRVSLDPGEKRSVMGILRPRPGTRKAVSVLRGFAAENLTVPYADRVKTIVRP